MYTDKNTIKAYLGVSTLPALLTDAILNSWIAGVQEFIDRYCNTTFSASAPETRFYDGTGMSEIETEPFTSITEVKILDINGTDLFTLDYGADKDYLTYPYNKTEKYKIILTPVAQTRGFLGYGRSVSVTGLFQSYTSVPDQIQFVATQLVARSISNMSNLGNDVTSESLGDYRVTYEKAEAMDLFSILDQYKKYEL